MVIYLEKTMELLYSGESKEYLRNDLERTLSIGLMKGGRAQWQKAEETKKNSILYWSIRTRNSLSPSSSRSFRTQSHWSFITGQSCNSERFLRVHLSQRMCNQFPLHHEFRIDTGRTKFEQKTDGILHVCGSNEQRTQRSEIIDLEAPRLAWYKQKTWKKHQNTVYWVDITLAQKKGLKFYQTRSHSHHPLQYTPSLLYTRGLSRWKSGEIIYEKVYESPRPLPKISFEDIWMKELGSEVAGQAERLPTNPTKDPKSNCTEQGRPVTTKQTSRFECSGNRHTCLSLLECESTNVRTGWPVFQLCASVCWQFR